MQIRNKLTIYFTITSSMLMLLIMTFIYLLFARITRTDFYQALHDRTEVAAQVYLEADEISGTALQKIKEKYLESLPGEVIKMYDSTNKLSFINESGYTWSSRIIGQVRAKKYLAYQENEKQVVGIDYDDNQGNFVILASATDVYGKQKKKNLLQIMSILFGVQLLIQLIAGRWFAGNALNPIKKVNAQVQKISATDLHLRVDTDNEKDEIGNLAANFNGLLERLEKSFDLQKMFVANASHELKTPVTNIIGEIDVAISKERHAEEYKKTLQSVLVEADRLNDIIRNFLLLANAENNIAAHLTDQVRLDELLWEIKDITNRQTTAHLDIQMSGLPEDQSSLYIKSNKTLLLMAINNIIQNAVKFSYNQPVKCSLQVRNGEMIISIADTGSGMSPDTLQNIFEPFFRSHDNRHHGNGIGLYIAKKIIELLGGRITVVSKEDAGSIFNIIFSQTRVF